MSMENAILELAKAGMELAAAIRESAQATREGNQGYRDAVVAYATTAGTQVAETVKGNTAEEAADKTETKGKSRKGVDSRTTEADPAPEPEQTGDTQAGTDEAQTLDYNKDVKPELLAAIKRVGKEQVQALIKSFGVDKGDQVDPAKLGSLLAKAKAL